MDSELIAYVLDIKYSRNVSTNEIEIDGLSTSEMSFDNGCVNRTLTRQRFTVPWTPTLFFACSSDRIVSIKRNVTLALSIMRCGNISARAHHSVETIFKRSDYETWSFGRATLVEFRFENVRALRIATKYMRDNAETNSKTYHLFATRPMDAMFDVSMRAYLNTKRSRSPYNEASTTTSSSLSSENNKGNGIDLTKYFTPCAWCRFDRTRPDVIGLLDEREIALNSLPADPLRSLPVVCFDIETIGKNESVVPRGSERDQRISSCAISLHSPTMVNTSVVSRDNEETKNSIESNEKTTVGTTIPSSIGAATACILFAYVPVPTGVVDFSYSVDEIEWTLKRKLERKLLCPVRVHLFRDEKGLLSALYDAMSRNMFLSAIKNADDEEQYARIACLLVGYNHWDCDIDFLTTRWCYYGMYDKVAAVSKYARSGEPRFAQSQISIDLMKHVTARHRAQLGSVALSHVSKSFGAAEMSERNMKRSEQTEKMNFDSVSIRRLYFDTRNGVERFLINEALEDLHTDANASKRANANEATTNVVDIAPSSPAIPSLFRVLEYNARDCTILFHLMRNMNYLQTVTEYSRHFVVSLQHASHSGNSYLFPNALVCRALHISKLILPYRNNDATNVTAKLYDNDENVRFNDAPSPFHMYMIERDSSFANEVTRMRISKDTLYIGGLNDAVSGHYKHTVAVDFASFYPSIGCEYKLSMETTKVMTVVQLKNMFQNREGLNASMRCELIRVFDYEPGDSPFRVVNADVGAIVRGKKPFQRRMLRDVKWYEGVEFSNLEEIESTSVTEDKRRVMVVRVPHATYSSVIQSLWTYYLKQRSVYKRAKSNARNADTERVYTCLEKMYKTVANSLYGYLNYERSVIYAPAVAAGVTLLARKTFHETTWLCERLAPMKPPVTRCAVVYKDTDGAIFAFDRSLTDDHDYMSRFVNDAMGLKFVRLETENLTNAATHCCIMGKKKYWKMLNDGKLDTKGFEKNAPEYVKHLVRLLERRVKAFVDVRTSNDTWTFRFHVKSVCSFFVAMYDELHRFRLNCRNKGRDATSVFAFNVALNVRSDGSAVCSDDQFVARCVSEYGYEHGDKVRAVFVLSPDRDCRSTEIQAVREFNASACMLNYYKFVRRFAIYLLQLVEGGKRTDGNVDASNDYYMSPKQFDDELSGAFELWCTIMGFTSDNDNQSSRSRFRDDDNIDAKTNGSAFRDQRTNIAANNGFEISNLASGYLQLFFSECPMSEVVRNSNNAIDELIATVPKRVD